MAKVKKITRAQQYQKELEKLNKRILTQEKKGYIVSRETLKELLPKEKKRYTIKDIEKVKNIKAKQIKESASEFVDIRTGEVFPTSEAKRILNEQREEARREQAQDEYIPSFDYITAIDAIISYMPITFQVIYPRPPHIITLEDNKRQLRSILYDTLAEYENESQYNAYLETVFTDIASYLDPNGWDSNSTEPEIRNMITSAGFLIKGRPLTLDESMAFESFYEF